MFLLYLIHVQPQTVASRQALRQVCRRAGEKNSCRSFSTSSATGKRPGTCECFCRIGSSLAACFGSWQALQLVDGHSKGRLPTEPWNPSSLAAGRHAGSLQKCHASRHWFGGFIPKTIVFNTKMVIFLMKPPSTPIRKCQGRENNDWTWSVVIIIPFALGFARGNNNTYQKNSRFTIFWMNQSYLRQIQEYHNHIILYCPNSIHVHPFKITSIPWRIITPIYIPWEIPWEIPCVTLVRFCCPNIGEFPGIPGIVEKISDFNEAAHKVTLVVISVFFF